MSELTNRKNEILQAAVKIAKRDGWTAITRIALQTELDCGAGTIYNHGFTSIKEIKSEVMRYAVERPKVKSMLRIIANGLALGDPIAAQADLETRKKALEVMVGE